VVRWGPIEFFLTLRDPQDPKPSHGLILHIWKSVYKSILAHEKE
jgi:hypothetical protein